MSRSVREPDGIKPVSFVIRAATAIGYAAAVVGSLFLGSLGVGALFGVMAGFCAAEFYAMERRESRLPNEFFGVTAASAMPLAAALWGTGGLSAVVTALAAASLVWHVWFLRVRTADTAVTVFGAVYTGFLLTYLVLIREFDAGLPLSLAVVASVWVGDSFAYLFGSTLGRHRLAPRISPRKSWEGFFAGTIGTVAVWAVVPSLPRLGIALPGADLSLPWALLTGLAIGIAALIGDLFESRMKREAGVKDSGNALPGHGGFLDRLDSLILVCLVAYWMLWWGGVR